MVVLVDANVVLDYILKREPFYDDAKQVMQICSSRKAEGCVALHTITTIWYLLRKTPDDERRRMLTAICGLLKVVGTSHNEVLSALKMTEFKDFEDCIQTKCAKTAEADFIITRNTADFANSEVKAITPQEFIDYNK